MSSLRRIYTGMRYREREFRSSVLKKLGLQKQVWAHGLRDELQYWERALSPGELAHNSDGYNDRLNPELELDDRFKQLIPAEPGVTIRILDVGSGPLTSIGKQWQGRKIEVVPIDPLADPYNQLLKKLGHKAPVPSIKGDGEKISEMFLPNSFDFVHSRNAIDHSYDPMAIIRQMIEVLRPGCYVYMWHVRNVAEMEEHRGLHQWNFDIKGGQFYISSGRRFYCVQDELMDQAVVECYEDNSVPGFPGVVAKIKKIGIANLP